MTKRNKVNSVRDID